MAIKQNFNGASFGRPGAYSQTRVNLSGGFPLAATGVVAIIGEATGGEPGASAGVQTFTSEEIANIMSIYKSGPIVDAARLLVGPARDNRVPNGASLIRVYKTNSATKAQLALKNAASQTVILLKSANYGEDENLIRAQVQDGSTPANKIVVLSRGGTTETMKEIANDAVLQIQYTGADASCNLEIKKVNGIKSLVLTPATTSAEALTISLTGKTVKDLVALVDAHASYSASTSLQRAASTSAADLDSVMTALDVKTAKTLRKNQKEIADAINSASQLVTAEVQEDTEGAPANSSALLSGGSRGASSNSSFQAGLDALLATRTNTVVPLISRDASALASEGNTDPASTFTVDAVNLQVLTHCIVASNTTNRSERNTYVSKKGSFATAQQSARELNHERASMLFQDVEILNASGNLEFQDPWAAACMLAGIQAGTEVGTPATFKFINATGIKHQDYNSKTQAELAIDAGLLPLEEADSGGFRVVVHNSTYGTDANFVYNRPSVLEAADYVAYNLRQQLEAIFIGEKGRTGTAQSIRNTVIAIMDQFLRADITVGDDTNKGLGFKDLTVVLNGNTAYIDITITPVQGVDFILNRITLDSVRQSA